MRATVDLNELMEEQRRLIPLIPEEHQGDVERLFDFIRSQDDAIKSINETEKVTLFIERTEWHKETKAVTRRMFSTDVYGMELYFALAYKDRYDDAIVSNEIKGYRLGSEFDED